jgi:hypothetical protein
MHLSVSFVTPPQFCELLPQRPNTDLIFGIALGIGHHNSNAPHSVALLRARVLVAKVVVFFQPPINL